MLAQQQQEVEAQVSDEDRETERQRSLMRLTGACRVALSARAFGNQGAKIAEKEDQQEAIPIGQVCSAQDQNDGRNLTTG